jgi:hypothetical protein
VMMNLKLEWKNVVMNLELLASTVNALRIMVKVLSRGTREKFEAMNRASKNTMCG